MNTDFRTDWNTIGDYSGLSGQPFSSKSSNDPVWSTAKNLANMWNKNKYRAKAEESNSFGGFAQNRNTSGGGSLQPLGKDSLVWVPAPEQPITVAGGQSSGGGLGSTIGGAIGTIGGALIGGLPGASIGRSAGSAIGGLIG